MNIPKSISIRALAVWSVFWLSCFLLVVGYWQKERTRANNLQELYLQGMANHATNR